MRRIAAALAACALVALALAGCDSTQTQTSQCGWIVTSGFQQSHGVKRVLYPNESANHDPSDDVWFVPCNARNYEITDTSDHGDRHNPAVATTKPGEDGSPKVQVAVYLSAQWTLNRSHDAMVEFWAFCQKYTCQSSEQNDNSANNSTSGWNSMLAENMSPAIDRAVSDAVQDFGPDLWNNQSAWPQLATDVSKHIQAELRASDRYPYDFFCAVGSDTQNGKPCDPPQFTVEKVNPVNGALRSLQNQQSELEAQKRQNDLRVSVAQKLYGEYWAYFLGLQDTIDKCHAAGQNCTIVLGNGQPAIPTK